VAAGARPSVPPVLGLREALADRRVFTLRSLDDALGLKDALDRLRSRPGEPARAAVLGSSFVGVKVAAVLHNLGLRVCLIEREPHILPLSAHPDCARPMETHLLEEGYELRLGAALAGVEIGPAGVRLNFGALPGASDPGGAGGTACEESATREDVNLMVVCTGIRPSLGFLAPGQLDTAEGILVDEQMRSNLPTLYAAGDVAQGKNLLSGRHEIIGLWASARYQGRAAGRSLAGAPVGYRGSVPHNITHVGRMLFASVGCMTDYDRMTICHDGSALQVRVWQDGRLAGVNLLDSCLTAGTIKQALLKAATGAVTDTEATWTSFNG
jgi:NADPH-dependent 2,4-dienoyl-CoA reductase/sulfur reductase-like enzyme